MQQPSVSEEAAPACEEFEVQTEDREIRRRKVHPKEMEVEVNGIKERGEREEIAVECGDRQRMNARREEPGGF